MQADESCEIASRLSADSDEVLKAYDRLLAQCSGQIPALPKIGNPFEQYWAPGEADAIIQSFPFRMNCVAAVADGRIGEMARWLFLMDMHDLGSGAISVLIDELAAGFRYPLASPADRMPLVVLIPVYGSDPGVYESPFVIGHFCDRMFDVAVVLHETDQLNSREIIWSISTTAVVGEWSKVVFQRLVARIPSGPLCLSGLRPLFAEDSECRDLAMGYLHDLAKKDKAAKELLDLQQE